MAADADLVPIWIVEVQHSIGYGRVAQPFGRSRGSGHCRRKCGRLAEVGDQHRLPSIRPTVSPVDETLGLSPARALRQSRKRKHGQKSEVPRFTCDKSSMQFTARFCVPAWSPARYGRTRGPWWMDGRAGSMAIKGDFRRRGRKADSGGLPPVRLWDRALKKRPFGIDALLGIVTGGVREDFCCILERMYKTQA